LRREGELVTFRVDEAFKGVVPLQLVSFPSVHGPCGGGGFQPGNRWLLFTDFGEYIGGRCAADLLLGNGSTFPVCLRAPDVGTRTDDFRCDADRVAVELTEEEVLGLLRDATEE
jgi:hypothetical protein